MREQEFFGDPEKGKPFKRMGHKAYGLNS